MPVGHPLKFKSVEELEKKIKAFFKECDKKGEPYTMSGLAVALDTSRKVLVEYGEREAYSNTIKKAREKCEAYLEKGMLSGKLNVTGAIFSAKNNYGWRDVKEVDQKTSISIASLKYARTEELVRLIEGSEGGISEKRISEKKTGVLHPVQLPDVQKELASPDNNQQT